MTLFAEIAVNVPHVNDVFTYQIPPELKPSILPGHLVTIPFGRQQVQGVVLEVLADTPVQNTKQISDLLDEFPVVNKQQISLAKHMAKKTLSPLSACLNVMLPPGVGKTVDTLFEIAVDPKELPAGLSNSQNRFLNLLIKRGAIRGRQIERALPRRNWQATARSLTKRGYVRSKAVLQSPSVRPKKIRTAQLQVSVDEALAQMENLARKNTPALERRQAVLKFLINQPGSNKVTWVYANSKGNLSDLKRLEELGLIFLGESEEIRDPLENIEYVASQPLELTDDQESVWQFVEQALINAIAGRKPKPILLFGVTSSGKTEIYLRALDYAFKAGKQAIILVPEIALTPQTIRRFMSRFPNMVGLSHSGLSPGERYDTWRRARSGLISALVGPRSALFTPFDNLGLIIVDECHDSSYYQSDPMPRFNARDLAGDYARLCGAVCLMGSATPDVVSTHRARKNRWHGLSLPTRIMAHKEAVQAQLTLLKNAGAQLPEKSREKRKFLHEKSAAFMQMPPVHIVDMREELKRGNYSIFSSELQDSLESALTAGQQAILFLNRRGTATYIFCRDCGYSMKCPRCDVPLTYHQKLDHRSSKTGKKTSQKDLICHRCSYSRMMPNTCPNCSSSRIKQYGMGTEKVETEVLKHFPRVRTLRWDWETTRKKGSHDAILEHFSKRQSDVLIGTQMLAKGLDLPFVTLVGVVLADVGLNLPDYRAPERAFQILTQVAGRAGRSPLGGKVVLQTFQPEHYVIQAASNHNYEQFYNREIDYRRQLGYPPFSKLVRLEYRHIDQANAENAARNMAARIQSWLNDGNHRNTDIIGPAPCFFQKVSGIYRWQIILRGPDPLSILNGRTLSKWRLEVDPPTLL